MLESCKEFTPEMVYEFQLKADEFGDVYFALTGRDGMTNYFHILRSGHFAYYLRKYRNLYRFSQQGWENVNGRFKRTFHTNTQKGGGCAMSKLEPVMYTMTRAMLWKYGILDKMFKHLGHTGDTIDVSYGKVKGLLQKTSVTDAETAAFADTIMKFGSASDIFGALSREASEKEYESDEEELEEGTDGAL